MGKILGKPKKIKKKKKQQQQHGERRGVLAVGKLKLC